MYCMCEGQCSCLIGTRQPLHEHGGENTCGIVGSVHAMSVTLDAQLGIARTGCVTGSAAFLLVVDTPCITRGGGARGIIGWHRRDMG
jgi:hypothetical protein